MLTFDQILKSWARFWYSPAQLLSTAVFRIALGCYMFVIYLASYPNWTRFYGPDATLPWIWIDKVGESRFSLFSLSPEPWFVWSFFWVGLAASLLLAAGLFARTAALVLYVILLSQLRRNLPLINGQDQIACILLFCAMFAPLSRRLSLEARWFRRKQREAEIWPLRLIQVSFCLLYVFAGPTKCYADTAWCDGSAMYYISLSTRWFRYPESAFFHSIWISRLMTWPALLLETAFPYLVWIPRLRLCMVLMMMAFHVAIAFLMTTSVMFFNVIMVIGLIAFLEDRDIERVARLLGIDARSSSAPREETARPAPDQAIA